MMTPVSMRHSRHSIGCVACERLYLLLVCENCMRQRKRLYLLVEGKRVRLNGLHVEL